MDFNVEELKYSNKIKSGSNKIKISGNNGEISLDFENEDISGKIKLKFDEVREIWAELLKYDKSKSEEISKKFDDNLYEANKLANKLSIGDYDEKKLELDDIKDFLKVYSDLIEHAKFGLATKKELEKQQEDLVHENSKLEEIKEKQRKFDEDAKKISEEASNLFPVKKFEGEAIEFEELLRRMEQEKAKTHIPPNVNKVQSNQLNTKVKNIEPEKISGINTNQNQAKVPIIQKEVPKQFKTPQTIAKENKIEETKISTMMSSTDLANLVDENKFNTNKNYKDIHVNSDKNVVNALFPEQKQTVGNVMKRKSELDNIDFSKL